MADASPPKDNTPAAKPTTVGSVSTLSSAAPKVGTGTTTTPTTPSKPAGALSPSASPTVKPSLKGLPPFSMGRKPTEVDRWFNFMCYGKPGSGKTTLMGSCADIEDMRGVLFIDAEAGDLAVQENARIQNPAYLIDNRVRVTSFKEVAMVHQFLTSHCKFRDANMIDKMREQEAWLRGCSVDEIGEPIRFKTIMMDSITEIDIYCTYGLLGITQEKMLHGDAGEIDVARFDEFRKNNQMMQMLCRAFRDLPMHFLASCHRTFAEDELKKRYYSPALTGQLKTQIPGFFDMVGYMDIQTVGDKIERKLWVNPVKNFEAKNRRSVFKQNYFEDPTMTSIMKGIGLLK